MSDDSVPRTSGTHPSTPSPGTDGAFWELLAQDLQVKVTAVRTTPLGKPKVRCLRVIERTLRNAGEDLERHGNGRSA